MKVAGGEATFTGEILREGDALILRGAHVEGSGTWSELRAAAQQWGRANGVKRVVIEGGKRTTGANPGHIPRPIIIEVE